MKSARVPGIGKKTMRIIELLNSIRLRPPPARMAHPRDPGVRETDKNHPAQNCDIVFRRWSVLS
jgi:hypothetical protein